MAKKPEKPPEVSALSFEEGLTELEEIVRQLEGGEMSLDAGLALYERGVALLRGCRARLDQAERRIRTLLTGPDGKPLLKETPEAPAGPNQDGDSAPKNAAPEPADPPGAGDASGSGGLPF
jgi:exodeoxyribonuclease VII small subunit